MIPTSAFRETIILILFGIVLVPIAAKRAQDAPGYWQTFSKELSSLTSHDNHNEIALCGSGLAALRLNDSIAYRPQRAPAHHIGSKVRPGLPGRGWVRRELTRPKQNATGSVYATSSAPRGETRAALTIRFSTLTASEDTEATTTTGFRDAAIPTPAPGRVPSTEPPTTVKQSEASKGRWTLIWMGSAIAAVAAFMSSC